MIGVGGFLRGGVLVWVWFFAAVLWCQSPIKESPYRITGVVLSSTDGSPVRRCHITATLTNSTAAMPGKSRSMGAGSRRGGGPPAGRFAPASNYRADVDSSGHFSLALPSPGAWNLTANAPEYATEAYEQHQQYSSAIVLTPEAPVYDLVFRLSRESSITGVVLDEASEPIRNAQVVLHVVSAPSPYGSRAQVGGTRRVTQTDDRGMYEFADLQPEQSFRVTVQARPWYAASAQQGRSNTNGTATDTSSALDPSLDVTYPLLWYPGVDDPAQAETVTLHAGENYQADFRLTPVPSIHLRIIPPVSVDASGRNIPVFPMVERVAPSGGSGSAFPAFNTDMQRGQVEVYGLSPGTYQIRLQPQSGNPPRTAVVEVTPGSVRTLDLSVASPAMANVTILLDGIPDVGPGENSIQIGLIDTETGQQFFPANGFMNGFGGDNAGNQRRRSEPPADRATPRRGRAIEVPPGRYEVALTSGRSNSYMTGITAQGADVHGRFVTFRAGDSTLTLHVATGLATVIGNVTMHNKTTVGAAVLLVPASLGDPGSFATIGQDQSNTDGSFDITGITPGQYILIAIDHGWQVNWSDPLTLRRYLMQGIPIDLASSEKLKQKVEAQSP
jgi:hypothetical protein